MAITIARGVSSPGHAEDDGKRDIATVGRTAAAFGRSRQWKTFLSELSMAMLMSDPIAYGWYLVWTQEARERP